VNVRILPGRAPPGRVLVQERSVCAQVVGVGEGMPAREWEIVCTAAGPPGERLSQHAHEGFRGTAKSGEARGTRKWRVWHMEGQSCKVW